MFSYSFHIRDYLTKTRHLSNTEDLAYRRLLDSYYTEEQPLPSDAAQCARLVAMREHVADVEAVLKEFFTLTPEGWRNERCDEEIAKYRAKADSARKANESRWQKRTDLKSDQSPDADQIPTINHKPITKEEKTPRVADLFPGVSAEVLASFVKVRRSLRAPITELAAKGIRREAEKAGITLEQALTLCVERSWRGFKAEWVKDGAKSGEGFDWDSELRGAL